VPNQICTELCSCTAKDRGRWWWSKSSGEQPKSCPSPTILLAPGSWLSAEGTVLPPVPSSRCPFLSLRSCGLLKITDKAALPCLKYADSPPPPPFLPSSGHKSMSPSTSNLSSTQSATTKSPAPPHRMSSPSTTPKHRPPTIPPPLPLAPLRPPPPNLPPNLPPHLPPPRLCSRAPATRWWARA
jgi:hypothetical protein